VGMAEATLRCVCGHSIFCEVGTTGEYVGFLVFFDNEPTSETYGQQIECCPNCGEKLGFPVFFRQNRSH
jgi:hypothetical protein